MDVAAVVVVVVTDGTWRRIKVGDPDAQRASIMGQPEVGVPDNMQLLEQADKHGYRDGIFTVIAWWRCASSSRDVVLALAVQYTICPGYMYTGRPVVGIGVVRRSPVAGLVVAAWPDA